MFVWELKEHLQKYGFKPKDKLGQNFLMNEETLDEIVNAAEITEHDQVLEIGPGIGNLTKKLSQKAGYVLAVEKDQTYFPMLKEELGDKLMPYKQTPKSSANVELVFADILRFNFQELLKPGYKVVANIPYYITGQIIEMLVTAKNRPSKIVLLVQKEVAERIVAKPGSLSILAISVQLFTEPSLLKKVPKGDFYPAPKVDSAVLVLDVLAKPRIDVEEKKFFSLVRGAFSGKRKQIHNTLKNTLKLESEEIEEILKVSGIDSKMRPQELSFEQWASLYANIYKK